MLLLLHEYHGFGFPVWDLATSRRERLSVYAPRMLGDRPGQDERCWINVEKVRSHVRSYARPWTTVDVGRFGQQDYALYLPRTKADFRWLCTEALRYKGCIEIITPRELCEKSATQLTPIWSTARPLRYLAGAKLCAALEVPWVYLLSIYNYAPHVSVVVCESKDAIQDLADFTEHVEDCEIIPVDAALATEDKNWEDIYRQFEEQVRLTAEDKAMKEAFERFKEEFERRYGN